MALENNIVCYFHFYKKRENVEKFYLANENRIYFLEKGNGKCKKTEKHTQKLIYKLKNAKLKNTYLYIKKKFTQNDFCEMIKNMWVKT